MRIRRTMTVEQWCDWWEVRKYKKLWFGARWIEWIKWFTGLDYDLPIREFDKLSLMEMAERIAWTDQNLKWCASGGWRILPVRVGIPILFGSTVSAVTVLLILWIFSGG